MSRRESKVKMENSKSKIEFVRSVCLRRCKLCSIEVEDVLSEDAEELFCYESMYVHKPQIFITDALPRLMKQGSWPFDTDSEPPSEEEYLAFRKIFCQQPLCNSANPMDTRLCNNIDFCISIFRYYVLPCVDDDGKKHYSADSLDSANEADFFSKGWDNTNGYTIADRLMDVADRVMTGKPKQKKKGNKQKPLTKKQRKALRRKEKRAAKAEAKKGGNVFGFVKAKTKDPDPTPCFFSNMSEEQLEELDKLLLNEDNYTEQDKDKEATSES